MDKFVYVVEYTVNKKARKKRFDEKRHAESFAKMTTGKILKYGRN